MLNNAVEISFAVYCQERLSKRGEEMGFGVNVEPLGVIGNQESSIMLRTC